MSRNLILLVVLLSCYISCSLAKDDGFIVPAREQCGTENACGVGQVCVCRDGAYHCVLLTECTDVAVVQTIEKSWRESDCDYTIYRVHIFNYGSHHINQINIATDGTMALRDGNSVWNIQFANGIFSLPSYSHGIDPFQMFSFGYIVRGKTSPNLFITAINFSTDHYLVSV
ncbi:hypothetical protein DLAC_04297 [Tieghemostelium lacteum]|uniref:Carbohydrate binding domain-containing protein n=1 Tax=Tieghemostelium lacteum TaxID=361077 RepID=A0A151ZJD6_TIELA|nr:hypothetical protein DLAC_04297 [Tieghemostelium lacteum]|eukprot:KYQ94025.1 hypothetical protein DLAC_04297 [Tieghemostelium lacteum]